MPNQPRTGTELAALEAALDQLTSRRELTYRCAAWFVGGTDVLDKLIANGADDETVIEYWRKRQEETDAVVNGYLREENADLRAQLAATRPQYGSDSRENYALHDEIPAARVSADANKERKDA